MYHNRFLSHARVRCMFIAGVAALVGTLSVSGTAGASSEPPRFTIESAVDCAGPSITFSYDDHVDGHVPQAVHEDLEEGAHIVWSADEVHQVNGDYFNQRTFPMAGQTLSVGGLYIYTVQITYDDGVVQADSALIDFLCSDTTSTTTAPTPEPDRFQLTQGNYGCGTASGGAFMEWTYGDYPDGHYAARIDIDLLKNGTVVEHHTSEAGDPSSDGAITSFDSRPGVSDGRAFDPWFDSVSLEPAGYSLSIMVTYEDGATDKHILTFDLNDLCDGRVNGRPANVPQNPASTTTMVPGGSLPETGASDTTWIIGSIGGLLLTTGAALFAGARRSCSH